jgi:hypothetical protein
MATTKHNPNYDVHYNELAEDGAMQCSPDWIMENGDRGWRWSGRAENDVYAVFITWIAADGKKIEIQRIG